MSVTARPDGSLAAVRAAIPEGCYRRSNARGLTSVVIDTAAYGGLLVLLVRADAWWQVLPLGLLAGLVVAALFVLGHDASHGALLDSDRGNRLLARVLMLPSLHVQEAWVLGHNRVHHGFTARQGMDFVWHPVTAAEFEGWSRWARARHRLEWSALGAGAYYLREVWWNKMVTFRPPPGRAAPIRRDWWLVAGWATLTSGASLWLGWHDGGATSAALMWLALVVVPFVVFIHVIGWTVHVHHIGPDIPWWTRDEWTRRRAQTESTTIVRAPWLLNLVLHNIFVHVPHHVDTRIPWYRLPAAATAIEQVVPGVVDEPMRLRSYLRSTRACKLYDFDAHRWHGYPSRRRAAANGPRQDSSGTSPAG